LQHINQGVMWHRHSRADLLLVLMPLTKPGNQFNANSLRWFRCVDSAALIPLR